MSHWTRWVKRRLVAEGLADGSDPVAKFKFSNGDEDYGEDHEHVQSELFKTVMSKYPEETMDFFNQFANRGDEEVSALLRKIRKDRTPTLSKEPRHPSGVEDVVPATADRGHNDSYGGGD